MKDITGVKTYSSLQEETARQELIDIFKNCPIPEDQILSNMGLFLSSKNLSRLLFIHYLYTQVIDVQGVIFDFGTRWGQNMGIFSACRGIYDPFNRHRLIVGFDTFSGFPGINKKDGKSDLMKTGNVSVTSGYEKYLDKVISCHEKDNTLAHIKKYNICKGNAIIKVKEYLKKNPQTIIALAYFDFDLYEPTKKCLEAIAPYLTKGSVLGFDELNDPDSPGETVALREVFGLRNIKLMRYRYASRVSYFIVD